MARSTVKIRFWEQGAGTEPEMSLEVIASGARPRYVGLRRADQGNGHEKTTLQGDIARLGDPTEVVELKEVECAGLLSKFDQFIRSGYDWQVLHPEVFVDREDLKTSVGLVLPLLAKTNLNWLADIVAVERSAAASVGNVASTCATFYTFLSGALLFRQNVAGGFISHFLATGRGMRGWTRYFGPQARFMALLLMFFPLHPGVGLGILPVLGSLLTPKMVAGTASLWSSLLYDWVGGYMTGAIFSPLVKWYVRLTQPDASENRVVKDLTSLTKDETARLRSLLSGNPRELLQSEQDAEAVRIARENLPFRSPGNLLYALFWSAGPMRDAQMTLARHEARQQRLGAQ